MNSNFKVFPLFLGIGTAVVIVSLLRRKQPLSAGQLRQVLVSLQRNRLRIATRPLTSELMVRSQKAELAAIDLRIEAVQVALGERVAGSSAVGELGQKIAQQSDALYRCRPRQNKRRPVG